MRIRFRVYGIPQTKGSTKAFFRSGMRYPVITNDNPKNKAWALCVSEEAARHRPSALWLGPIRARLVFHVQKPKALPKRKPSWPKTNPDLDKYLRSVFDALTGVIWRDDAQVVSAQIDKIYSDAPGVEITLEELSGV